MTGGPALVAARMHARRAAVAAVRHARLLAGLTRLDAVVVDDPDDPDSDGTGSGTVTSALRSLRRARPGEPQGEGDRRSQPSGRSRRAVRRLSNRRAGGRTSVSLSELAATPAMSAARALFIVGPKAAAAPRLTLPEAGR